MRFCPKDETIMSHLIEVGELYFICPTCAYQVKGEPNDTLFLNEIHNLSDDLKYNQLMKNAIYDPSTPLVKYKCKKCNSEVTGYIYIGDDMNKYILCTCGLIEQYVPEK